MKKLIAFLSVMAILACLCACQKTPQTNVPAATTGTQAATKPTEAQLTTQPTVPVDPMVTQMQELLNKKGSYLNSALMSVYETPADVDLFYLFYGGFSDEPQKPMGDEMILLENTGAGKYWPEMDLIRLPVEKMDATLTELFGITLEQTNGVGLERLIYLEETNCYYSAHTGMEYADIRVFYVVEDNGNVVVHYNETMNGFCKATLIPTEDGSYQILSNVKEEIIYG